MMLLQIVLTLFSVGAGVILAQKFIELGHIVLAFLVLILIFPLSIAILLIGGC